jgi:hypothetical protein
MFINIKQMTIGLPCLDNVTQDESKGQLGHWALLSLAPSSQAYEDWF